MKRYKAKRLEIAQKFIMLDGKPFNLYNYPPFQDVYNVYHKQVLLFTARQVSKSTTLANLILINSMRQHWRSLYVAPSQGQRNVFSNTRLGKVMHYSPLIDKIFASGDGTTDQVGHKMWKNGSEIYLSYADKDPDRIRGISSNENFYDEVQDMDYDQVIPVVNETLSASPYGMRVSYSGTPKTMESAIQSLHDASTKTEWHMKCTGCNKYNIPGIKNLGKYGPICASCGKALNVRQGFWADTVKDTEDMGLIKGYRIPQLILPLHAENPEKWKELMQKFEGPTAISNSKFKNEVMAMSDSLGKRMITLEDLKKACVSDHVLGQTHKQGEYIATFAGIDWSGEGQSRQSCTSLWIWGIHAKSRKLRCVYYKVYNSGHPLEDVEDIISTIQLWRCTLVVGDRGGGAHANAMVNASIGENRVFQVQWGAYKTPISWTASNNCYYIDKTTAFDSFFLCTKKGLELEFGKLEDMQIGFNHFLSEYEEVTQNGDGRRVWRRSASKPDDALHAAIFGWIGFKVWADKLSFYT
jgi:hypothetical protein